MRTLSLMQPWADFVVDGLKTIETRRWETKHTYQWILIHASKRLDKTYCGPLETNPNPARGAIIGMVYLECCFKFTSLETFERLAPQHRCEPPGLYEWNKYGWILQSPIRFVEPIPRKGMLGLWTPPPDVTVAIEKQLNVEYVKIVEARIAEHTKQGRLI